MNFTTRDRAPAPPRARALSAPWRALLYAGGTVALVALAGCGPVRLVANTNIPTPLIVRMPIAVALFVPKDFAEYVHNEERTGTEWNVSLGKAQNDGITRLLDAMFERVVRVDSVAAGAALGSGIRAILEPSIEEYAFVTPRDAGSPFFAVSIKYRVNVYTPEGKLADSWGFTGYGTSPAQGLSSANPLAAATALAMRDAGAKLAVEFREQAVVRGLVPAPLSADRAGVAEEDDLDDDSSGEPESGEALTLPEGDSQSEEASATESAGSAVPENAVESPTPSTKSEEPDEEEAPGEALEPQAFSEAGFSDAQRRWIGPPL